MLLNLSFLVAGAGVLAIGVLATQSFRRETMFIETITDLIEGTAIVTRDADGVVHIRVNKEDDE